MKNFLKEFLKTIEGKIMFFAGCAMTAILLIILLMIFTPIAKASQSTRACYLSEVYNYIGVNAGIGLENYKGTEWNRSEISKITSNQAAGRIFIGHGFNRYLATEFGYTYYGKILMKDLQENYTEGFHAKSFDAVLIAKQTMNYGFTGNLKGGVAYVNHGSIKNGEYFKTTDYTRKIVPVIGIGMSYDITDRIATDVGITRFLNNGALPRTDFYAIGLSYKI